MWIFRQRDICFDLGILLKTLLCDPISIEKMHQSKNRYWFKTLNNNGSMSKPYRRRLSAGEERANSPKRTRMRELPKTAANIPLMKVQRPPILENPFMTEFSLLSWVNTHSEESIIANVRRVEISGARRIAMSVPGSGPRESMRVTKKVSTD